MKKVCVVLMTMVLPFCMLAQNKPPVVRGYAYMRESVPGVAPKKTIDEQGNTINRSKPSRPGYLVYLEFKQHQSIRPEYVRIDGRIYKATVENIVATPVIIQHDPGDPSGKADTLVRATNNNVIQLHLSDSGPSKAKATAEKNRVTIQYTWRGKKYTYVITKIKKLPAAILQ